MLPQSYYRCWVEVDFDALRHNVRAIRRRLPAHTGIIAVVKADAYGHGLAPVAGALMQCGVESFAVANLTEAIALRHCGGHGWPILLFGAALPFEIEKIVQENITPTISALAEARLLEAEAARQNKRLDVQAEVDTGMGRVGFWHEGAAEQIAQITQLPHLRLTGLYTHFPSADDNLSETRRELSLFLRVADQLRQRGVSIPTLHAANSAALLNVAEAALDMVRPGLLLYGICPVGAGDFRPVLTFKARVAHVKEVDAGRSISYGQTFFAPHPMKIATIAAGYADGFSRSLSNKAEVLIGSQRCRVVGRVTMDQIMVDVTGVPNVNCGDEAVFIGKQGAHEITAVEVAQWEETIPWEVLCAITKTGRVPRVYHGVSAA
jgi:alanine racemase